MKKCKSYVFQTAKTMMESLPGFDPNELNRIKAEMRFEGTKEVQVFAGEGVEIPGAFVSVGGRPLSTMFREEMAIAKKMLREGNPVDVKNSEAYGLARDYMNTVNNQMFQGKLNVDKKFETMTEDQLRALPKILDSDNPIEVMKFIDPKTYAMIRDSEEAATAFWGTTFADDSAWKKYRYLMQTWGGEGIATRAGNTLSWLFNFFAGTKTLGPKLGMIDLYKVGQTIVNFGGMPFMMILNTTAVALDVMLGFKMKGFTQGGLQNIRKDLGVMYDEADLVIKEESQMPWIKTLMVKVGDAFNQGLYNAGQIAIEGKLKNDAVSEAIHSLHPEFDNEYDFMKRYKTRTPEERGVIAGELQTLAEHKYNKITGMRAQYKKGDILYDNAAKEMIGQAYLYLAGWGMGTIRSVGNTLKDAQLGGLITGKWGQKYLEVFQKEGKKAADDWIIKFYTNNQDVLHLSDRIFTAIIMGDRLDRVISEPEGDNGVGYSLPNALKLAKMMSAPWQALESTPFGRTALTILEGLMSDKDHDGLDIHDVEIAGIMTVEQFIKDITKRFVVAKSIMGALGENDADTTKSENILQHLFSAWKRATGGYMYYSAQEVTDNGYNAYVPKTTNSYLGEIFGIGNPYIDTFRNMNTDLKYEELTSDPTKYWTKRKMFNIPFFKDYNIGRAAQGGDFVEEMIDVLGQDKAYIEGYLRGDVDWKLMGKDGAIYAFNLMKQFNPFVTDSPEDWFDDIRQKFLIPNDKSFSGESSKNPIAQNQEDLFSTEMMVDLIKEGRYNDFLTMFQQAETAKGKAAADLLAYANTASPGAGKKLLAAIMQTLYYKEMTKAGDWQLDKHNPAAAEAIKKKLGETYGNYLYIVDKPNAWANIGLFYIKQNYPRIGQHISDIGETKGSSLHMIYDDDVLSNNKSLTQAFALDMIAKTMIANGDINGYKMQNAFATIYMPTGGEMKSEKYVGTMLSGMNRLIDYIKKSSLSDQEQYTMISGIFGGAAQKLGDIAKDREMIAKVQKPWDDTMAYLFGITKEIRTLGQEIAWKNYQKDKFGINVRTSIDNWYSNGNYKSPYLVKLYAEEYGTYKPLYDAMKELASTFKPYYNRANGYPSYGQSSYSEGERNYMISLGKYYDRLGGAKFAVKGKLNTKPKDKNEVGRTPKQFAGFARPKATKTEDPDKLVEFNPNTFKRTISRKSIKFNSGKPGKSRTGRGLYNESYSGGNRKRRVSRAKGRNSKGSNKYKQANR